jgi:hypothetical protein
VLQADGGVYRCLSSEDCPRRSDVFVCASDANPDRECVKCVETRCVEVIPNFCHK